MYNALHFIIRNYLTFERLLGQMERTCIDISVILLSLLMLGVSICIKRKAIVIKSDYCGNYICIYFLTN